jgi:hypothetical protein
MSFTLEELRRIEGLENIITQLAQLVKGGGSKNQLNRLLVLAQGQVNEMKARVEALEAKAEELLTLARKLQ